MRGATFENGGNSFIFCRTWLCDWTFVRDDAPVSLSCLDSQTMFESSFRFLRISGSGCTKSCRNSLTKTEWADKDDSPSIPGPVADSEMLGDDPAVVAALAVGGVLY